MPGWQTVRPMLKWAAVSRKGIPMTDPAPLPELACNNCGAPIKTTARPGTQVSCDCCGSVFLIPEPKEAGGNPILADGEANEVRQKAEDGEAEPGG